MTTPRNASAAGRLALDYPMSLAVYDDYAAAQAAVDHLADHDFPVQNVLIVGTDLKQVERVTGRLTWGRVLAAGALSGAWLGLFIGLIFGLFTEEGWLAVILSTVLFGVVFGLVWAAIGYLATQGRRDFTSVQQTIATRYEVLVEHKHAEQARTLLAQLPGAGSKIP
jgi:hypothetical protein